MDEMRRVSSTLTGHTMADVHVKAFQPTSLLRFEEPTGDDSALPEVESFVPNGLLGCHLATSPSRQDMPTHVASVAPSSPFKQNGLLGPPSNEPGAYKCNLSNSLCLTLRSRGRDHATERPTAAFPRRDLTTHGCCHQLTLSPDDDLPDIPDILKRHPRPLAEMSSTTPFTPIILPRPSLRSSTFDGKTVYLKRKSRTIGLSVRFPKHKAYSKPPLTLSYARGHVPPRKP